MCQIAERYLNIICKHSAVVSKTISGYGDGPLSDFLNYNCPETDTYLQKREDLLQVIYQYAAPLLGESIAYRAILDLDRCPIAVTANHHGVDFFAQSVQGSLIFFLMNVVKGTLSATVPIFSFGNVPLNNLTYPRGLLLYQVTLDYLESVPRRIPIFPDQFKRRMVSVVAGFQEKMVYQAVRQVNQMVREGKISSVLGDTIRDILGEDYCGTEVLSQSSYSRQSVILNSRIWKRLFSAGTPSPDLVYLEIEKIVGKLLELDLCNPRGLVWCVMFEAELREQLLVELDGIRGCWEREKLTQRCSGKQSDRSQRKGSNGCGTLFFWGIDEAGRRIPLSLESERSVGEVLRGVDDDGQTWEMPYTPDSIIAGLQAGRLLPSLFTCFLVVSFARGVTCIGGYYQAEYLPLMQQGLLTALKKFRGYGDIAGFVQRVLTDRYLSGMQTVMCRLEDDCLIPAGPVEIIAGGGLTTNDFEKMLSLTVKEAHLASLFETVPDIAPWEVNSVEWKKPLAAACSNLLSEKVVIK